MIDFQNYLKEGFFENHSISKYGYPLPFLFGMLSRAYEAKAKVVEVYSDGCIWYFVRNKEIVRDYWPSDRPTSRTYIQVFDIILRDDPYLKNNITIISQSDEKVVFQFNYE